jgi:opacity protein-like surface antigen
MKKYLAMLAVATCAMLAISQAQAADLSSAPSIAGIRLSSDAPFSGFYNGASVGLENQNIAIDFGEDSLDGIGADGFSGALYLGYDVAAGQYRFGPWIEAGISNVSAEASVDGFNITLEQDYYAAVGLRAGVVRGQTLYYGRAGYQLSTWNFNVPDAPGIDVQTWLVGIGAESQVNDNISVRLSADYLLVDHVEAGEDYSGPLNDTDGIRVMVGFAYRP